MFNFILKAMSSASNWVIRSFYPITPQEILALAYFSHSHTGGELYSKMIRRNHNKDFSEKEAIFFVTEMIREHDVSKKATDANIHEAAKIIVDGHIRDIAVFNLVNKVIEDIRKLIEANFDLPSNLQKSEKDLYLTKEWIAVQTLRNAQIKGAIPIYVNIPHFIVFYTHIKERKEKQAFELYVNQLLEQMIK